MREAETELRMGHVPMMIGGICILYYRENEIFDTSDLCNRSNDNKTATMTRVQAARKFECIYGITKIESNSTNIYRWDLQIGPGSISTPRIGISSERNFANL